MRGLVKHTVLHSEKQKLPYTYQRNGIYYFCYRVPTIFRKYGIIQQTFRISLHTQSYTHARKIVNSLISQIEETKAILVANNIKQGLIEVFNFCGLDKVKVQIEDDPEKELAALERIAKLQSKFSSSKPEQHIVKPNQKALQSEPSKLTIRECYTQWAESWEEQGLSTKEQENHRRNMAILLYLYGDKQPESITPKQADEVLSTAKRMPRSNMKPYNSMVKPSFSRELRDKGYIQRIKMARNNEVPESDRVASFSPVLKSCQGFYNWMASKYIVNDKPFNERRIKNSKSNKRGAFTVSQLQRVVDFSSQQTDANKKWIPLIMAYTGMRNSEIQGLERSQFKVCEDSGLFHIQVGITTSEVGKAKTEAGIRRVPLAQPLIDLGLMEYINSFSQPNERIFSVSDKWLTRYYGNTLKHECKLPDHDSSGHILSMYSTRHSVVTLIRSQGANEAISTAIVGHESGTTIHDGYTKRALFPLKELKVYVDGLPWKINSSN